MGVTLRTKRDGFFGHMRFTRGALVGLAFAIGACGGAGDGEEAKSPDSVDQDESSSLSPMEQLQAIPKELQAQADNLTKPIDDVQKVIDQLTSIPKRYGLNAAQLRAMARATLETGTVNVPVDAEVTEAAQAEIKSALNTLNGAVAGLKATPEKVAALMAKSAQLAAKVPALAAQVTASATAAAANPFGAADAKAKATADLQAVKQVQVDVMKVVSDTRAKIVGVPGMATGALKKLMAALKGDGTAPSTGDVAAGEKHTGTPDSASAATSGSKLAVVRVSVGPTQEARVRQAINAALAGRGLGAVPAARLEEATTAEAGAMPPDAALEANLRATLGAAVTVRVSRGDDDSVHVSVSTSAGAEQTKELADTSPARVSAAVTELLDGFGLSAAAPATARAATPAARPTAARSMPATAAGPSSSAASATDQVLLKDGTTIRGHVSNQAPGTYVTIEMADGAQRTIPWDRVKEVIVAPPATRPPFDPSAAAASLGAIDVSSCTRSDGPSGSGHATVTFSAAGTVETATLRPPFAGTDVGACVARNFGSAHVPAFNGGRISVGKTFVVPAP